MNRFTDTLSNRLTHRLAGLSAGWCEDTRTGRSGRSGRSGTSMGTASGALPGSVLRVASRHAALANVVGHRLFAGLDTAARAELTRLVGWFLHEPGERARRIARDALCQRAVTRQRWHDVLSRRLPVAHAIAQVCVHDAEPLRAWLASTRRGSVVTTFHAGDYLGAFLALATLLPAGRQAHVLRRITPTARAANDALDTLVANVRVVGHDAAGVRRAIRALRRGDLLVVMCDMPADWGATAPLTVCGRQLWWTRSVADFAALGRADVLIVSSRARAGGHSEVDVYPVLRHEDLSAERTLTTLGRVAEACIRAAPEQWHQWPLLPRMLVRGDPSGAEEAAPHARSRTT